MPAPVPSIRTSIAAMGIGTESKKELLRLLLAQNAALKAVLAKLDADAGVTDTNYAATAAALLKD